MKAIDFVYNYRGYVAKIEEIADKKFEPAIKKLKERDPHDLVVPNAYFNSECEMEGLVFKFFLMECLKLGLIK